MLLPLKYVGCNLDIKFHFLHGNIDFSPEKLGDFSKERLHQDTKVTEKCSGDSLVFEEGMWNYDTKDNHEDHISTRKEKWFWEIETCILCL